MDKLNVIIADDEKSALDVLEHLIKQSGKAVVLRRVSDATKVESIVNKYQPDLLFLDVQMPGVNGLELLARFREYNRELCIVMVSAYDGYITEAIKYNVFSYLLKPVNRKELNKILTNLHDIKSKAEEETEGIRIKLPISGGYSLVEGEDIFMLKADGNYTKVYYKDLTIFTSSYNMGRLLKRLPEDLFLRINRGCALNTNHLKAINKSDAVCTAEVAGQEFTLELSQTFIKSLKKRML